MLSLALSADGPLVDQIVTGIKRQIDDRLLRPGTRLPSIRSFAGKPQSQSLHRGRGL